MPSQKELIIWPISYNFKIKIVCFCNVNINFFWLSLLLKWPKYFLYNFNNVFTLNLICLKLLFTYFHSLNLTLIKEPKSLCCLFRCLHHIYCVFSLIFAFQNILQYILIILSILLLILFHNFLHQLNVFIIQIVKLLLNCLRISFQ
jgi:hypothetical protein